MSPDGEYVAYTLSGNDLENDSTDECRLDAAGGRWKTAANDGREQLGLVAEVEPGQPLPCGIVGTEKENGRRSGCSTVAVATRSN